MCIRLKIDCALCLVDQFKILDLNASVLMQNFTSHYFPCTSILMSSFLCGFKNHWEKHATSYGIPNTFDSSNFLKNHSFIIMALVFCRIKSSDGKMKPHKAVKPCREILHTHDSGLQDESFPRLRHRVDRKMYNMLGACNKMVGCKPCSVHIICI